jgi:hypothetical protein
MCKSYRNELLNTLDDLLSKCEKLSINWDYSSKLLLQTALVKHNINKALNVYSSIEINKIKEAIESLVNLIKIVNEDI